MTYWVEILSNKQVNKICYYIELYAPDAVQKAAPGQFFHVQVREGLSPLLRRPISIHYIDREKGTLGFLYQVKGEGTVILSKRIAGEKVSILGPLGKGFKPDFSGEKAFLIGGGIGIAPLFPLAKELRNAQKSVTVLIGARTKDMVLCEEKFLSIGCNVAVSTDDGTYGHAGYVSALFQQYIKSGPVDFAYLCGPEFMMAEVEKICRRNFISGQVSIEARMGCGIGACLCCSHEKEEDQAGKYVKVCVDGPVFDLGEVKLHAAG
ncbi:MAG: dihydroorotate dehydrogenase electron transfer subunit [Dehalobacterium sp.]